MCGKRDRSSFKSFKWSDKCLGTKVMIAVGQLAARKDEDDVRGRRLSRARIDSRLRGDLCTRL
jgi:hypothetical protein